MHSNSSLSLSLVLPLPPLQDDLKAQFAAAGGKLVVIDFYADWCGPCKMIAPVLEEISGSQAEKVVVVKVNVDDHEELSQEYNISSMPTFVFVKNGAEVDRFSGANEGNLRALITKLSN